MDELLLAEVEEADVEAPPALLLATIDAVPGEFYLRGGVRKNFSKKKFQQSLKN